MYLKFYRPTPRSISNVLDNKIYASSPIAFNDPFEAMCVIDDSNIMHKGKIPYFPENMVRYSTRRYVVCFTKEKGTIQSKKNILMWSHYAASHTGFCIEYNDIIKDILEGHKNHVYTGSVVYSENLPQISISSDGYDIEPILTKSKQWEYECEERFIFTEGGLYSLGESCKDVINAIYIGCKFDKESKLYEHIISFAKENNIPCFQAILSPVMYELDFVKISDSNSI